MSVRLERKIEEKALLMAASEGGLTLSSGDAFFNTQPDYQFVRLPFCALTPIDIVEGVRRLGEVVDHLTMSARNNKTRVTT